MNWRGILSVLCMLTLAVIGLSYRWQPLESANVAAIYTQDPDMQIAFPFLEHFDETGKLAWQITGEQLRQFEANDYAEIDQPRAVMPQTNPDTTQLVTTENPWHARAKTAALQKKAQIVDLIGDAQIWNFDTSINSQTLRLYLERQFVETNKAVTIRDHSSVAQALGMQADLINETLFLRAQVKEIHDVATHPQS